MHVFSWRCPNCSSRLNQASASWQCEKGHTFDKAKEGYVNLLLAHQKNSKAPGDSKQMVNARQLFLQSGAYMPLVESMIALLVKHASFTWEHAYILDAGCGEGYYLQQLAGLLDSVFDRKPNWEQFCGIDISKDAVRKAAKRVKQAQFAVASTFSIPLDDDSHDTVIQVFAPSSISEIARILKPKGLWLMVSPADDHLFELKQHIYDKPEKHQLKSLAPEGLTLIAEQQKRFSVPLSNPEIRSALLMMTPFYWQASEQKKDALKASLEKVTAHFHLQLYRKV